MFYRMNNLRKPTVLGRVNLEAVLLHANEVKLNAITQAINSDRGSEARIDLTKYSTDAFRQYATKTYVLHSNHKYS